MNSSPRGPSKEQIRKLIGKTQIKSSEAYSLISTPKPGKYFLIEADCWRVRDENPDFGRYATRREFQIVLEHQEELKINFPVTPNQFYRWSTLAGNPIKLFPEVVEAFREKNKRGLFELSETDIFKMCPGRVGWKQDVRDAFKEILSSGQIPARNFLMHYLKERDNLSILSIDDSNALTWITTKKKTLKVKPRTFTDHIDDCLRNLKDAANAVQDGSCTVEYRDKN